MNDRKAWRIAVIAGKGGVGKTTTTINLGASLAAAGWPCLLVDCDPQSNLTSGLGLNPYERRDTVAEVLCGTRSVSDTIVQTPQDGLDLVPASPDLSAVEDSLPGMVGRELRLRDALMRDGVDDRYAVVLFDTPPNFGYHTISALAAAHRVLVPLQMSGFALRGLKEVIRTVSVARRALNQDLEILGAVPTFVSRTRFSRDLLEAVGEVSPVRCFKTTIMHTVKLQETSLASVPIMVHAPGSRPDQEYRALAAEVVEALHGVRSVPAGLDGDAADEPSFEDVAAFRSVATAGTPEPPVAGQHPDPDGAGSAPDTDGGTPEKPVADLTGHAAGVRLEIVSVDVPKYAPPAARAETPAAETPAAPVMEVAGSPADAVPAEAATGGGCGIASDRAAMTWLAGVARAAAADPPVPESRSGRLGRLFRRR